MSSSISSSVEVGVVAIGPIINILAFIGLGYMGAMFYKVKIFVIKLNIFLQI